MLRPPCPAANRGNALGREDGCNLSERSSICPQRSNEESKALGMALGGIFAGGIGAGARGGGDPRHARSHSPFSQRAQRLRIRALGRKSVIGSPRRTRLRQTHCRSSDTE